MAGVACGGFSAGKQALTLFFVQLVFNTLWSWLFFAWQRGGLAFADILLLWVLIIATMSHSGGSDG